MRAGYSERTAYSSSVKKTVAKTLKSPQPVRREHSSKSLGRIEITADMILDGIHREATSELPEGASVSAHQGLGAARQDCRACSSNAARWGSRATSMLCRTMSCARKHSASPSRQASTRRRRMATPDAARRPLYASSGNPCESLGYGARLRQAKVGSYGLRRIATYPSYRCRVRIHLARSWRVRVLRKQRAL